MPQPKKNTAYTFTTMLASKATPGFQANPTIAAGDFKVSIDGGAFANLTNLPVVEPAGGRRVKIALTAAEMNGDLIDVQGVDAAGDEWQDIHIPIQPNAKILDDIGTTVAGALDVNIKAIDGQTGGVTGLDRSTRAIATGTVGTGSLVASIVTSSLSPSAVVSDQFKGRIVVFAKDTATAALRGQATDILSNTTGGVLTVTALTTAPASGDTFAIV